MSIMGELGVSGVLGVEFGVGLSDTMFDLYELSMLFGGVSMYAVGLVGLC